MNEGDLIPTTFLAISPQEAEEQARNNLSIINSKGELFEAREEFIAVAAMTAAPKAKLNRMYKAADKIVAATTPNSACRNGCSYCCHTPVAILQLEADILSQVTGRKANRVTGMISASDAQKHHRQPCPFLVKGKCSVYANRPMVCRLLINLSNSPYYCNTDIPAQESYVAMLNLTDLNYAFAGTFFSLGAVADIRDFFPLKPNQAKG